MKTPFEVSKLYKEETGRLPVDEALYLMFEDSGITVERHKALKLMRRINISEGVIDLPDPDYIEWLEQKVLNAIKS